MSQFRPMNKDEKRFFDILKKSKEKESGLPASDFFKFEKKFGKKKAENIAGKLFEAGYMYEARPERLVLLAEKHGVVYKDKRKLRKLS